MPCRKNISFFSKNRPVYLSEYQAQALHGTVGPHFAAFKVQPEAAVEKNPSAQSGELFLLSIYSFCDTQHT